VHELSVAVALVERACEKAVELGDVKVEALRVRVGPLSGVVKEALLFSFDVAAKGTAIEGARLEVEDVPLTVHCAHCARERTLASPQHLRCPVCGESTPDVRRGRELELTALEVLDDVASNR
jgi:hydrogenase nickel incorporation protein HypA/HybF